MAPPKKSPTAEEIDEIKNSLNFLTEKVSDVSTQQKDLLKLLDEVKHLRLLNDQKDKKIEELERRVEELEQYSRINDVVITGLNIRPRSYAKAVTSSEVDEPREQEESSAESQVVTFLQSKGIHLDSEYIEACHPLPRRSSNDTTTVIMRFANRKHKIALLRQGKLLKGTNVYINDHLIKKNGDIAKKARFLKKQGKIQRTWVFNCKIYIKLNGTPEEAKVLVVKSMADLDKFQ